MLKTTVFAVALAAAVPTAFSQTPASSEIQLDCVVINQQGQPVDGLRAGDFQVMEDDAPQQLVRLEESGSGQSAEVYPVVLVLVGQAAAGDEPDAVAAAVEALGRQTAPGFLIAVFRMADQLELLLPFSDKAAEWSAAVKSAAPGQTLDPHSVPAAAAPDQTAFATPEGRLGLSQQILRLFALSDPSLRRSPKSSHPALIQAVSRALSGIAGRKTLILIGTGLQSGDLKPFEVQRTIDLANAFRLTVYSEDETPAENSDAGVKRFPQEEKPRPSPLLNMIHQSGGFLVRPETLVDHLERALYEARRHYRLYYRSRQPQPDGRSREVYLNLRDPKMEGRQRSSYPARPAGLEMLNRDELLLLQKMRQTAGESPLKADLSTVVLQRSEVQQEALVSLGIPASSLQILDFSGEGREGRMCRIQASGLLLDSTGAVLRTFAGPLALTLDPSAFEVVERDGLALNQQLPLVPGRYLVQVGVLDDIGGKAAWLVKEVQVEPPQDKPRLGPLLLGRLDRRVLRGRDPFAVVGDGFVPSASRDFPNQGALYFACEIYNTDESAQIQAYLEDSQGVRTDLKLERKSKTAQPPVAEGSLDLSNLSEGNFELVVEVGGGSPKTRLEAHAPFRITP